MLRSAANSATADSRDGAPTERRRNLTSFPDRCLTPRVARVADEIVDEQA